MFFARRTDLVEEGILDAVYTTGYTAYDLIKSGSATPVYDEKKATIGWAVLDADYALISKTGAVQTSGSKKDGNDYTIKFVKANATAGTPAYWYITY